MADNLLIENNSIRVRRCRNGLFIYNINDMYIGKSLELYGEYSEMERGLFNQIIQPGMSVLDIGANIGIHTVSMAQKVGAQGQVIAFEPQRVVYQMMCGNLSLNNITNTTTLLAAVGKTPGSITVPRPNYDVTGNFGGISLGQTDNGEVVPLLTLDSLNLPRCHFIKLDVEGMEQEAIEGAAETLKRHKPILYMENDRQEKSEALIHTLLKMDYRLYWHVLPLFNPNNFYANSKDVFPGLASINMLGIPRAQNTNMQGFVEITAENASKYISVLQ